MAQLSTVSFAHDMKDSAPHCLVWKGFWEGIGVFLALAICTWIAKHTGIIPIRVIELAVRLIPPEREAWTISLVLFGIGVLGLVIAYKIPVIKLKRQIADGTVIEAIGPHVPPPKPPAPPSGAFTSASDIYSPPRSPDRFYADRIRKEDM